MRMACKYTERLNNMKTKTKTTAAKTNLVVVREPSQIDSMFKRNRLGYLESGLNEIAIDVSDAVGYVVTKLDAGQSSMRDAILFTGWVFKNKPEAESKAFADELKTRWTGSTIPNLVSIAKALPSFEEKGLSVDKVRDLYGLREVSKLIKDGNKDAVALLNNGESPRAVKQKCAAPSAKGESEPQAEDSEPINIGNETEKLAALLLGYADKFAKLAENEDRLKMARQIVAKLNLGSYLLMHADAAAAVQTLKAKK
jgi:hypothetical protein